VYAALSQRHCTGRCAGNSNLLAAGQVLAEQQCYIPAVMIMRCSYGEYGNGGGAATIASQVSMYGL
jgi:hypothetical protein